MQKKLRITIDTEGNYGIEALEGFSGTSCVEQTKSLEMALGGTEVDEGKTEAYFNGHDDNNVLLNI